MDKPSVKPLQENEIKLEQFVTRVFFLDVDVGAKGQRIEVADLFRPECWAASTKQLRAGDRVRVMSRAQGFDFLISVLAVTQHGVLMRPWPHIPQGLDTMKAVAHLAQIDNQAALRDRVFAPKKTPEAAE